MLKRAKSNRSYILILTAIISLFFVCSAGYVAAADAYSAGTDDSLPLPVHRDHTAMGFTAITEDTAVLSGGLDAGSATVYYFLDKDINLTGNITVEGSAVLCLNGFKLMGRDDVGDINGPVITVNAGAHFTLCDCVDESGSAGTEHKYYVDEDGCYVFYEGDLPQEAPDGAETGVINGGVVTGGVLSNKGVMENVYHASAVQVEESAVFDLESGTIAGNVVADVSGGRIVDVAENSVFNMTGGAISGNVGSSANVCVAGEFNMHGGEISHNIAQTGGGVSVSGGAMLMSGGKIAGNIGRGGDGGVEVLGGEFTMSGGEITENRAQRGDGGAVSVGGSTVKESVFIMNGGTIAKNKAYNLTDGVYVHRDGTFILNDGYFQGKCGRERSTDTLTINGGYFAVGDPEKNTVEGITLAGGKAVTEIYDGFGDENFKEEFPFAVYNVGETVLDLSANPQNPVYDGETLTENVDFYLSAHYKWGVEKINADIEYSYASADGVFVSGLPSDAGEYTLKATVKRYVDPVKKIYCPDAEKIAVIKVEKAVPKINAPQGLTAVYGDTLSKTTLPAGWTWKDGNKSVGNAGERTFAAIYTPAETDN